MPRPIVVCSLVATLLCHMALASPIEEPNTSDAMAFIDNLQQQSREGGSSKLRELTSLYESLILSGAFRDGSESEEGFRLPLPLQVRLLNPTNSQEYNKDKRASYMSLCHFKICNMGRKRSSWNTWARV